MEKDKNEKNKDQNQHKGLNEGLNKGENRSINKGFSSDKPKPDFPRMESKPPTGPKK